VQLATDEAAIVNNREIPDISYPGIFQPFGGFAGGIAVENSYVKLPAPRRPWGPFVASADCPRNC
jgi:hypothetical protein